MTNKDYSSDQRYDKELDEALKNLIANARNTDMASGFLADEAKAKLSALLRRVEVEGKWKGAVTSIKQYMVACENAKELPSWNNLNAFHAGQLKAWKELEAEL